MVSNTDPAFSLQTTNHIVMVRPSGFAFDPDAATDNHFMQQVESPDIAKIVNQEFDTFVAVLQKHDIKVEIIDPQLRQQTPNAVFCNNVFSTHVDSGKHRLILYPMRPLNRRLERHDLLPLLRQYYSDIVDLSYFEDQNLFLESTGSLVLDRAFKIAYVNLSERAYREVLDVWARIMGYQTITFTAQDARQKPIYHTNVMMSIGTKIAVLCSSAISDDKQRQQVVDSLQASGRLLLDISWTQLDHFCGNVIELGHNLVMSTRAYDAFTLQQRELISGTGLKIVHAPLTMIEDIGGGSARCTIGELF
jgi:hypothetical protein